MDKINNDEATEDEPPANTMEELLFRELAVLKLGLKRDAKPPFLLRYSEDSGRGLIAMRNIKTGEVIMEESPAVWGPKSEGACCLECGLQMQELSSVVFCDLCHLHFCSSGCCSSHPSKECIEMQKLKIKTDSLESLGKLTLVIVVLRCILLPETAPQNSARIRLLQDHLEERKDTKLQNLNQMFLVSFLRDIGIERNHVSDTEIHRICGILDSNAFESKTYEGLESRALFPLSAMANSSCLPNMTHVTKKDRKMVMVATRDIMKGQELFICYTGIRWGKLTRQKHLLLTKNFVCQCPRCLDPTECGTYISSIQCTQCPGHVIQQVQAGPGQEGTGWHCQVCEVQVQHSKVVAVEVMIGQIIKLVNKSSTQHLEGATRKLSKLLSPQHYILLELYMSLVALYEKKKEKPERIVELCAILLPILTKLEGSSRAVAFLQISLIKAQVELFTSGSKELKPDWIENAASEFKDAFLLIEFDVQASDTISQLKSTLELLENKELRED